MVTINVASFIGSKNAIIQKFGLEVFNEAAKYLSNGERVSLDFKELANTTTGFFHASIGNLVKSFPDKYDEIVTVSGLEDHPDWLEKYEDAINLARNPQKATDIDRAISILFE